MNNFLTGLIAGVTATSAVLIPLLSATVPGQTGWDLAQAKDRISVLEKQLQDQTAAREAIARDAQVTKDSLVEANEKLTQALAENLFIAAAPISKILVLSTWVTVRTP